MAEGDQQQDSLGWRAGLPDDLKAHESIVPYKTVGDFAKAHLETAQKLKDAEGKLGNSIPKLSENATQEERNQFFNSLGRPEKPDGYQLEGGDPEKEKILAPWKQDFHELGLTASQAQGLKAKWDGRLIKLVDQHNLSIQQQNAEAEQKLKTEWGDKYQANLELATRFWKKEMDADFDTVFKMSDGATRLAISRFVFKIAAKTGEDNSQHGRQRPGQQPSGYDLSAFKLPPKRI